MQSLVLVLFHIFTKFCYYLRRILTYSCYNLKRVLSVKNRTKRVPIPESGEDRYRENPVPWVRAN